ncbi:hypothetical protein CPKG_00010 [Cyanophage KBS-S-2A]|jgi:hypothetical protein|uniref:hypothetical protein n=1 Tax=Cyanophage KBS-S-2A TaxID=889953 RepID=UPI0002C18095|nr:hypothetical protein CPKG_00010 [Cyanophage KBS-S-2A]AGH57641.1 hypothetical protein CPKG_00010 [Cyanophage KBS-S-2A]
MSWAQWMVVELPLEEQLSLEKQSRIALLHDDTEQVRKLCAQLIKQNHMQQILLKQAVGRIMELEATVASL